MRLAELDQLGLTPSLALYQNSDGIWVLAVELRFKTREEFLKTPPSFLVNALRYEADQWHLEKFQSDCATLQKGASDADRPRN